jgi:hypothetical protein
MQSEFEVAQDALSILRGHGEASLLYLTAEFAPFSNQRRPDILFTPEQGPRAGECFVAELKLLALKDLLPHQVRGIIEHQSFVRSSADADAATCHFAFATDAQIPSEVFESLAAHGIHVVPKIRDGRHLASEIILWANAPAKTAQG